MQALYTLAELLFFFRLFLLSFLFPPFLLLLQLRGAELALFLFLLADMRQQQQQRQRHAVHEMRVGDSNKCATSNRYCCVLCRASEALAGTSCHDQFMKIRLKVALGAESGCQR